MQPNYNNNRKNNARNILLIAAIALTLIIVVIIVIASMPGGNNLSDAQSNISSVITPTPYGTEVITPFYTPTKVPTVEPVTVDTPEPTSAPTPTSAPINMSKTYKKGDEGDDILTIQNMLIDMGFNPGVADGQFGSQLKDAIKNFQLYEKLDDDGIAGPTTINYLVNDWQEMTTIPQKQKTLQGVTIGIDAGHQQKENTSTEPVSPGSSKTVIKSSDGTYGRWTDAKEYVINLQIALKLKNELEALGATVIMTRETNNVDISNSQRAKQMNNANVDCWVQIYANGDDDKYKRGMMMLVPKDDCMDTTDSKVYGNSNSLSETLLNSTLNSTNAKDLGTLKVSSLASFNYSKTPVCLIAVGYLSNETEDKLLVTKDYQNKIVSGLVNGFKEYFSR